MAIKYQIALSTNHGLLVEPCTYYSTALAAEVNIPRLYAENSRLGEMSVVSVDTSAPITVHYGKTD